MNNSVSSTKPSKMIVRSPTLGNLEIKLKKTPSISPAELQDEIKSLIKSNISQYTALISPLISLLTTYKQPTNLLIKVLCLPQFKDNLKINAIEAYKEVLEPLYKAFSLKTAMKTNEESQIFEFIKLLTKFRFQHFNSYEKNLMPILEFLSQELHNLKPKEIQSLYQNPMVKYLMDAFMNIISKLPEFKEPRTKQIANEFYSKIHQIFFKTPIAIPNKHDPFLKVLISLFRILGFFLDKLDDISKDLKLIDTLFLNLYKFLFVGTAFQTSLFGSFKENSLLFQEFQEENALKTMSSASEFSDMENFLANGDKHDELSMRVRHYSCLCLAIILRNCPKVILAHWNKLLRGAVFPKELIDFLKKSVVSKSKGAILFDKHVFQQNFPEPSLFFLMFYEKSPKVRIDLINLAVLMLENLPIRQWLAGFSFEKAEKVKETTSFLPISQQIYNSLKNLNWIVLFSLLFEEDAQVLAHFLKQYASFLGLACFEKFNEEILVMIYSNYLLPLYLHHENSQNFLVKANALACISVLLTIPLKNQQDFEEKLRSLVGFVLKNLEVLMQKGNQETLSVLFLMEIFNFFAKIQKNFHGLFMSLEAVDTVFPEIFAKLRESLENSQQKDIVLREMIAFLKVFEEITRANNPNTMKFLEEMDNDEENVESFPKENSDFSKNMVIFVKKLIFFGLEHESQEISISALNILGNLQSGIIEAHFLQEIASFLELMQKSAQKNVSLKTSIYKTLGLFGCHESLQEKFSAQIVGFLVESGKGLKNLNAKIKNAWALANWLSKEKCLENIESCAMKFPMETLYNYIVALCQDSKEKVLAHGFRALGFFLRNSKKLSDFSAKTRENINELYVKALKKTESPKIIWNACVSLRNLFLCGEKALISAVFNETLYFCLLELLQQKNSCKSQLHAAKTLKTSLFFAQNVEKLSAPTIKCLISCLKEMETEVYEFVDAQNSLETVKGLLLELIFEILQRNPVDSEIFAYFFKEKPQIFECVNLYVHHIRENYRKFFGFVFDEQAEALKIQKKMAIAGKVAEIDELPVKGEETISRFRLDLRALERKDLRELCEKIRVLKGICAKITNIIDTNEKIAIPFILYDTMKEYAEISVEKAEETGEVELKVLRKSPL